MTILDQLINLMLEKVEVVPVPKQELDDFLSQHHIKICDEHYRFLLKYGNSGFLKYGYANWTFDYITLYYLDDEFYEGSKLPDNCDYIGGDISTEALCIDRITKNIFIWLWRKRFIILRRNKRAIIF